MNFISFWLLAWISSAGAGLRDERALEEPYPYPASINLENHLDPLSDAEIKEINSFCSGNEKQPPQDRIIGGERVKSGIPYAAVLVYKCGATFISQRHLLTAAHCLSSLRINPVKIKLMAGGVCFSESEFCVSDGNKQDMVELEVEFAIFSESNYSIRTDLAIMQLKKAIPDEWKSRIGFACLPNKGEELPEYLTVNGWGRINDWQDEKDTIPNLKQINLTTRINDATVLGFCSAGAASFCMSPLELRDRDEDGRIPYAEIPYQGDSGSGAVRLAGDAAPYATIFGVVSIAKRTRDDIFVGFVDVRDVLDDFCRALNLCVKGAVVDYQRTSSNFRFNAIYFPQRNASHYTPRGFKSILDVQNKNIVEECEERRKTQKFPPRVGWAAAVVDAFGEYICAATFVTRRHLVTTRTCITNRIISAIQRGQFKPYRDTFYVAAGGSCLNNFLNASAGGNCDPGSDEATVRMDVAFAAFSSHGRHDWLADIAIIELIREDFMPHSSTRVFPACINPDLRFYWRAEERMLNAYAWGREEPLSPGEKRNFIRHEMKVDLTQKKLKKLHYTDTTTTTGHLPQPMTPLDQGAALVDPDNGDLAGLFLQTDPDYDMYNIIYPVEYLENILCIYLNRCTRKAKYYSMKKFSEFNIRIRPFANFSGPLSTHQKTAKLVMEKF